MLWEHNSTIVVMLVKLRETARVGFACIFFFCDIFLVIFIIINLFLYLNFVLFLQVLNTFFIIFIFICVYKKIIEIFFAHTNEC